ncbi:MAG: polysaccharide deacetylase family protein [Terriglobales bacterium]
MVALHRVSHLYLDDELSIPPVALVELCRYWSDHFEVISLNRMLVRMRQSTDGGGAALAITFDDGYADNFERAAPILDLYSLPATFFVTTGAIGSVSPFPWDRTWTQPPRMMDWNQVRALHAMGFGIGSHTVTHPRLSEVRDQALREEIEGSGARLAAELGAAVEDFAYPFGQLGDCDGVAREAVRRAGYRTCFSCHGGLNQPGDSPWQLRRMALSPRFHATPRGFARAYSRGLLQLRRSITAAAARPPIVGKRMLH